jgi:hypothetical protein
VNGSDVLAREGVGFEGRGIRNWQHAVGNDVRHHMRPTRLRAAIPVVRQHLTICREKETLRVRIPGLARSRLVESELAARELSVFSSDTDADDWHHRISGQQIIALTMRRLEGLGKGSKNALFLDGGSATSFYLPVLGRNGNFLPLGPIIGVYGAD